MNVTQELTLLAERIARCELCDLHRTRKHAVPGEGPADAEILFIGEGPGFYENEQGRPFVGAAGKFLDDLLEKAGVSRGRVYITNVVKCRPPGNRDPLPEEISTCTRHYLNRQIELINPGVIVTLGRFSMGLFVPNGRISSIHGKPVWVKGRMIVPMFHPAAALHQPKYRSLIEADFARLPEWLQQARQQKARQAAQVDAPGAGGEDDQADKSEPTQLSLF